MVLQPIEKYLYWSFGLHLAVFFALLVGPSLFGKSYHFRQEKVMWVSLPKGTSDTLGSPLKKSTGLPMSTIEEQKKALESPQAGEKKHSMTYTPPKEAKKPPPRTPPPPRRPGHPKSRIENALARLQKQVATKQVEQEAGQVPETQPGGFTFGSATANYVSPDDPEYVIYQMKIRQKIMDQWILPMKYTGQDFGLICRIIVHINDKGEVSETEWEFKSGNPSFDMSALRSIEKSSPLDIPPERLKYEVYNEGFIVEFKPTAATQTTP